MPSYDPSSLLPAELPADFPQRFVDWIVAGPIRNDSDMERIVACDRMIRSLSERRKKQNRILIDLEKNWTEAKRLIRDAVVEFLDTRTEEGKVEVTGGCVYKQGIPGHVSIADESGAIEALAKAHGDVIDLGLVEVVTRLTSDGKKAAVALATAADVQGLEVPWATRSKKRESFAIKADEREQRKRFNYEQLVEDYFLDNPAIEVEDVEGFRDFGDRE